jgi:Plavaka transposase
LASDKTQLSQFSGDKQAWPVYLSIGNIEKAVRRQPSKRGTILLAYIPVTKLECLSPKEGQGRAYRLFHYCMAQIIKPLIEAGKMGVSMTCADNYIRHVFPILASYIADYPEQCLIAANKENSCPVCEVRPDQRGEPLQAPLHTPTKVLVALRHCMSHPSAAYKDLSLRPIDHPFWTDLPHTNIFLCFTPDLLHQLHKGVFKDHLVKWCTQIAGEKEIDERFKCMPRHPTLRHFKKGISSITQWTGHEYKEMEQIFASLIYGAVPPEATAAARAIIDFIYYASFPSHSTETLRRLQDSLDSFHEHKGIFIKQGVRTHFRVPKIHMMEHYVDFI